MSKHSLLDQRINNIPHYRQNLYDLFIKISTLICHSVSLELQCLSYYAAIINILSCFFIFFPTALWSKHEWYLINRIQGICRMYATKIHPDILFLIRYWLPKLRFYISKLSDWSLESFLENTRNQKNLNKKTGGLMVNFILYHF